MSSVDVAAIVATVASLTQLAMVGALVPATDDIVQAVQAHVKDSQVKKKRPLL